MIKLTNVTKRFGERVAVDDISFEVEKGEIVGFLGPNGAGKTTTMRIITGFFPPTEGTVKIGGIDISEDPIKAKEKIGYMPENVPLYKDMDVTSYLSFVAEIKGIESPKCSKRVKKAIEETGLTAYAKSAIWKLSKGFRQRVGLAQAIINDPDVLILDEPTVGLDPKQIIEIRKLIKQMKGERTIILSTHILPEVSMTCDKVIVINEGKIIAQDAVDNLVAGSETSRKAFVLVDAPKAQFVSEIKKIKGVADVEEEGKSPSGTNAFVVSYEDGAEPRPEIVAKIVKNGWDLVELRRHSVSLEDVFLRLVTKEGA